MCRASLVPRRGRKPYWLRDRCGSTMDLIRWWRIELSENFVDEVEKGDGPIVGRVGGWSFFARVFLTSSDCYSDH